ncbi:EAL domain-containing protein [Nitratireductor sp. GCM10026969]|uniref:EAL domain-containing protein n=1 Tax=Nitratireductor sp. GCM10026969 TaxID=3252645 RepID=UPI0036156778
MSKGGSLAERIEDAILVDEVGIETGRYGPYFLKTLYRPVLRRTDAGLLPCGVKALTGIFRDGEPVAHSVFLEDVPGQDRWFISCLCRMLHLRNYYNADAEDLPLFLGRPPFAGPDLESILDHVDAAAECLDQMGLDPMLVFWEVDDDAEGTVQLELAACLRRHRLGVAVADFGVDDATLSRVRDLDPDVVSLNGLWFQRIAEVPIAARLLSTLVDALRREGKQVLAEGIESPSHLHVALEVGADFVSGDLLRPARLAGTIFDTEPVSLDRFAAPDDKVVSLFSDRGGRPA